MAVLSSPTIEDLITNVRNMLFQPSPTNSTWTDEELAVYFNEGIRRFFVEVVKNAEGQFTTTADLDIVAGSDTVDLPDDFFQVKQVWRKVDDGYEPMHYRNNLSEGFPTNDATTGSMYVPDYYLRGNSLVLRPRPSFNEVGGLKIEYIQFPETMVTGGDSLTAQVAPVFRDLIEMYAVYKAKLKESLTSGTDTTALAKDNLNDLYTAFKAIITPRSHSQTAIIPFNPEEY